MFAHGEASPGVQIIPWQFALYERVLPEAMPSRCVHCRAPPARGGGWQAFCIAYAAGFVLASGLLHVAGLLLGRTETRLALGERLGRLVGGGIALSGALMLGGWLGLGGWSGTAAGLAGQFPDHVQLVVAVLQHGGGQPAQLGDVLAR